MFVHLTSVIFLSIPQMNKTDVASDWKTAGRWQLRNDKLSGMFRLTFCSMSSIKFSVIRANHERIKMIIRNVHHLPQVCLKETRFARKGRGSTQFTQQNLMSSGNQIRSSRLRKMECYLLENSLQNVETCRFIYFCLFGANHQPLVWKGRWVTLRIVYQDKSCFR